MFELLNVYETAISEKNEFLRKIYIAYTRRKLKKVFFKKFLKSKPEINYAYLIEFFQFYNCTQDSVDLHSISNKYPSVNYYNELSMRLSMYYMDYIIKIGVVLEGRYVIDIYPPNSLHYAISTVSLHFDDEMLNNSFFKEIINMVIYNYCVAYIYGNNGKFVYNTKLLSMVEDYFIC